MSTVSASTVRRVTATLFVSHATALAGLYAATAIGSLTGVAIAGTEKVAGLPSTFTLIGGALAAYPAGRLMSRVGRRIGLAAGYATGIAGGLVSGLGVLTSQLGVFLMGMLLLGAARATSDQARYAAADVSPEHQRARAVSTLVFAGTIGAVAGPALATWAGDAAQRLGYSDLTGAWFISAAVFALALVIVSLALHPDPRDLARAAQAAEQQRQPAAAASPPARSFRQVLSVPEARLALTSMALAQATMVMVMVVTPVHMRHFGHNLANINFVLAAHIVGMFGLSMLSGWLTDRRGHRATIGLGAVLLIAACLVAPQNPDALPLAASLFLLGLGWNMCFVAGSALLTDALGFGERARLQGAADLVVNLASAAGSLSSGLLLESLGYGTLAVVGASLPLILAAFALRSTRRQAVAAAGR